MQLTQERNYPSAPKENMPDAIRRWGDSLKGQKRGGGRVVAGWEWDGKSPTVLLIFAPSGNALQDIPHHVWIKLERGEDYA